MGLFSRRARDEPVPTIRTFHHHPVLGTDLTGVVRFGASGAFDESELLALIDSLEDVFSAYRAESTLSRWRLGEIDAVGPHLAAVLGRAHHWFEASDGAFNPAAGIATQVWASSRTSGRLPTADELNQLVNELQQPRFSVDGDNVSRLGDCTMVNLNAIAKGYIADRAAAHIAALPGVESNTVNIGGDLVHRGSGATPVSIQNPMRPYDNEPPLFRVRVSNAGIATSGSAARGWDIEGNWYSHVIDPRTAQPVSRISSASVVAPTAMEADALATVFSVMATSERQRFANTLAPHIAYCVVDDLGTIDANDAWHHLCT